MVILQLFMKMDGFNLLVKSHNCRFGDCKSLLCVKKVDLFSKSVYSQCIKPLNVGALIIWISLQHTWQKNS